MISRVNYYKRKTAGWFWWANLLISLTVFGGLYCILNSPLFLGIVSGKILGVSEGHAFLGRLLSVAFLYGQDFLWGHALVFAVAMLMRESKRALRKSFAFSLLFETGLEILMLLVRPEFALAPLHILAMLLGNVFAFLLIILHEGME